MLELTLNEILHVVNPLREDLETRMQIIDGLRDAISTVDSLRGMPLYSDVLYQYCFLLNSVAYTMYSDFLTQEIYQACPFALFLLAFLSPFSKYFIAIFACYVDFKPQCCDFVLVI